MMIDTRENALAEAKAEIRRARRAKFFPTKTADFRRDCARMVLSNARDWRDRGEMEKAVCVARVARGHLIIARAWDREAKRIEGKK